MSDPQTGTQKKSPRWAGWIYRGVERASCSGTCFPRRGCRTNRPFPADCRRRQGCIARRSALPSIRPRRSSRVDQARGAVREQADRWAAAQPLATRHRQLAFPARRAQPWLDQGASSSATPHSFAWRAGSLGRGPRPPAMPAARRVPLYLPARAQTTFTKVSPSVSAMGRASAEPPSRATCVPDAERKNISCCCSVRLMQSTR